jgi:hypothetical protein
MVDSRGLDGVSAVFRFQNRVAIPKRSAQKSPYGTFIVHDKDFQGGIWKS